MYNNIIKDYECSGIHKTNLVNSEVYLARSHDDDDDDELLLWYG